MSFTWPLALLLLLAVPAVLGAYWWKLRRRRKQAVRYSSVALLRSVMPKTAPVAASPARSRCCSPASSCSRVAPARPQIARDVPIARTSIILALDVSRSMCSTDVEPNRLAVAQEAARDVRRGPGRRAPASGSSCSPGSRSWSSRRRPIASRSSRRIDGLTTGRGTAIGAAMLKGLDAIAEVNPRRRAGRATRPSRPASAPPGANGYVPDIVVLLTDGANTRGIEPLDAVPVRGRAPRAGLHDRLRHDEPAAAPVVLACNSSGGEGFGSGGFGGGWVRRRWRFGGGFRGRATSRRCKRSPTGPAGVLPGRGRRSAREGVRGPAEGRRGQKKRARSRRCSRRSARCSRPPRSWHRSAGARTRSRQARASLIQARAEGVSSRRVVAEHR